MKIRLTDYTRDYLELSWAWLNDPDIKTLTNTRDFSKHDQTRWYNQLYEMQDYKIWGIEADSKPIGACGLKNITESDCEYWGYIGEKDYWGKGIGKTIMNLLENKANSYYLKSIWLQVLHSNLRAQNLYKKMGYQIEKENSSLIFMRKQL